MESDALGTPTSRIYDSVRKKKKKKTDAYLFYCQLHNITQATSLHFFPQNTLAQLPNI